MVYWPSVSKFIIFVQNERLLFIWYHSYKKGKDASSYWDVLLFHLERGPPLCRLWCFLDHFSLGLVVWREAIALGHSLVAILETTHDVSSWAWVTELVVEVRPTSWSSLPLFLITLTNCWSPDWRLWTRFLEVIEEFERWFDKPLISPEEAFMTAQVTAIFVASYYYIVILKNLLKWYTLWTYYRVIFSVVYKQRHFDVLNELVCWIIFLIGLITLFSVYLPVEFLLKLVYSF